MTATYLTWDIERLPLITETWGLWDQNIGINQIVEPDRTCAIGLKWRHEERVHFLSEFHQDDWLERAHKMLCAADIWVTFNGKSFDVPHMNTAFKEAGMSPLPKVPHIDLYRVAKQAFRYPSNKLDYIAQRLGIGQKVKHEGHTLWTACRAGDPKAWAKFKRYCIQDVRLTEGVLDEFEPWIASPPHAGLFADDDELHCVACGSTNLQLRGTQVALAQTYQRLHCQECGKWQRGTEIIRRAGGTRA